MTLAVLSDKELDAVTGGGFYFKYNPQTNLQGAQIAVAGDNVVLQNNSSGNTAVLSNSGIAIGVLAV
jgi:bacteriocin-like protein